MEENRDEIEVAVEVMGNDALEALNKSEIQSQLQAAHTYPRNLVRAKKNAMDLATMDRDIAESCMYALKRGGKTIIGPSVRLAEIVVSSWGNIRASSRITGNNGTVITAQAVCHDLESNVAICMEVRRSIKDRNGKTYSEDMQVVAGNAASAIALRNAVFKVIPGVFTKSIFEAAQKVAVGDAMELTTRRTNALAWFGKFGITEDQILAMLEKSNIEEVGSEELTVLIGIKGSVTNGESTIHEHFQIKPEETKTQNKSAAAMKQTLDKSAKVKEKKAPVAFKCIKETAFTMEGLDPVIVDADAVLKVNEQGSYGDQHIPFAELEKNPNFQPV